jgi:DNA-binding transcriptional regulator YiaG
MTERRIDYRYDECGLDNVILEGFPIQIDDDGDEVITIPAINVLHRVLAYGVATKEGGLAPKEIRFLRTEMGMSQAELADLVGRDGQTVGRWERAETNIDKTAEMVLRVKAIEFAEGDDLPIEEIARRTVYSAVQKPYVIDATTPGHYHQKSAA